MRPTPQIIRVIDLETTGSAPPAHGVCEIGWQDVALGKDGRWELEGEGGAILVNPGRAIPPITQAIHHILDEDVAEPVRARFRLSIVSEARALFFIKRKEEWLSHPEVQHDFTSRTGWGYSKFCKNEDLASLVRRRGLDRFSIRCDIVVLNGFRTEEEAPSAAVPPSDLHKHLGDLLQSGRGTDVVFEVGGEAFAAHRCVLAARSPVISADLLGAANDGAAAAGVVRVDGVEPRAFKALLRYAYTDSLPEMDKEEEGAILRSLLMAAERYGLPRLKTICEDKLCRLLDVATVEIVLALAEQHHCDRLKEACLQFLAAPANLRAVMRARGR